MKLYIKRCAYFFVTLYLSMGSLAHANPTPSPIQTTQPPSMLMQPQIWNLKNADIRAVIQTISMVTGKNFIVDPRVQGKVTFVSHAPMTPNALYSAFLSMLQVLNFVAVPSDNAIKIIPAVDANGANNTTIHSAHSKQGAQLVVRVIQINNVSAIQLIPALRPLMPQWASLTAYAPSNSIILASTAANINHLVEIIHHMDSQTANETIMVALKHANATAIAGVIETLQSGDRSIGRTPTVSIAPDTVSNSILISGNVNNVGTMRSLIQKMDANANADNDLTKVIPLKYLSAKKLAPVLAKIAMGNSSTNDSSTHNDTSTANSGSATSTSTPTTETNATNDIGNSKISVQPDPDSDNAIIIRAPRDIMQQLTGIIKKLDVKPQQVLVEAIIVRMDHSLLDQLGINWGTVTTNTSDGVTTTSGTSNTFALKVSHRGIGIIADGSLQALVQALKSNASTDILSTPSIVVLNGQKATISDGQNVGIVNREYQASGDTSGSGTDNGGVPFNTIERKDVALSLTVTPQISPSNMLRLKIKQEDDTLASTAGTTTSTDSTNPTINTSKIMTNVLIHSNDILVLGGLTDHQAKKNRNRMPILGDIPLLGHLFSYTSNDMEKKDLMIFMKPVILNTRLERNNQTIKRYHYMRQKELGAIYDGKTPKDQLPVLPNIPKGKTTIMPTLPPPIETIKQDQG